MGKNKPTKEVLAANLNRLMAETLSLQSNPKLSKRAGLGLGTIARIRNADVAANLDTVDALAECFNIQSWKMLVDGSEDRTILEANEPQPSALGLQLAWLFDDAVKAMGHLDKSKVYLLAAEVITRPVTPSVQPSDKPSPAGKSGKQSA